MTEKEDERRELLAFQTFYLAVEKAIQDLERRLKVIEEQRRRKLEE